MTGSGCNMPARLTAGPAGAGSATGNGNGSGMNSVYGDIGEPFWIQIPLSASAPQYPPSITANLMAYTPTLPQYVSAPATPRLSLESDKVQDTVFPMWCDPDEAFIAEIKKLITVSDKIIFWEMAKAIMELPRLAEFCDSSIRNSKDLAALLKRTEFKFLWSADAPDLLPKDAASELISAAYVVNY